jgi:hypothetical protein
MPATTDTLSMGDYAAPPERIFAAWTQIEYGVVGIRLPEPDRSAFLQKYEAEIFRADPA